MSNQRVQKPKDTNTQACKMLLEALGTAMLHHSDKVIQYRNDGLSVSASWLHLDGALPVLRLSVVGLAPLNWLGPQPGALPNTDAAPEEHPYDGMLCPDCGAMMVSESGCLVCKHCGYNKCG